MKKIIKKISPIFAKKYRFYWILAIIAVVILGFIFLRNGDETQTLVVHPQEFLQQVAVSGKIIATEVIDLSFEQSGQVKGVYAKEGDSIKQGQLLASQDTLQLSAQLAETKAGIQLQEAKLAQLLAGESPEDIRIAENNVVSAQQDLVSAYDDAFTVLDDALTTIGTANNTVTYMKNTYFSAPDQAGIKIQDARVKIQTYVSDAKMLLDKAKISQTSIAVNQAIEKVITSLNGTYEQLGIIRAQCEEGIYSSSVSTADKTSLDTRKSEINAVLADVKSSKQEILSYSIALEQAQNQLALAKAPARSSDIAVYEAQIAQAKALEQNILSQIRKKQIYAPIAGIVTNVDSKLGSIATGGQTAVSIISADPFLIESYIPEIYIPLVKIGDAAEVTLDAYGQDTFFQAQVVSIDPAETVKDGVATYRAKFQFVNKDSRIKSGMTANVIVTTEKKDNVISVPQGIIVKRDGKKFVKVQQGKEIIEKEVQTGIISSLGNIEIVSGLNDGDVVVIK